MPDQLNLRNSYAHHIRHLPRSEIADNTQVEDLVVVWLDPMLDACHGCIHQVALPFAFPNGVDLEAFRMRRIQQFTLGSSLAAGNPNLNNPAKARDRSRC